MRKIYLFGIILLACFSGNKLVAQQLPYFSQYMFNPYLLNPAAAGIKTDMPIVLGYRSQWSGLVNAPTTFNLSAHTPFTSNVGLGGMVYNDNVGPTSQSNLQFSYAYHLKVGFYDLKLALGLAGMLQQHVINFAGLTTVDADPLLQGSKQRSLKPNAGFGTYLYNNKLFVGYSLPHLFELKSMNSSDLVFEDKMLRHNFITAGYKFNVAPDYELEPSILFKDVKNAPSQLDLNTKLIYKQSMWMGLSYRTNQSIVAMLGVSKNKLSIGYAYDLTLSNIRTYAAGSHEFFVGININKISKKEIVDPVIVPEEIGNPSLPTEKKEEDAPVVEEDEIQED
jgi:type IX secretion system PorP/SprF family membrane protein